MSDAPFLDNIERAPLNIVGYNDHGMLIDEHGDPYMDFWADESTTGAGYGKVVNEAMKDFIRLGIPHQLPDIYPNPVRTQLAEDLCNAYGYERVFFGNSGADAIETALKVVRKYQYEKGHQERTICYTLKGNFHGRSYGALALSDSIGSGSLYHKMGFGVDLHDPNYGVIDEDVPLLQQVDVSHTAAIFMAPVLGNNVVKGYSAEFMRELRRFCTDHGILLVFDEIQTGSGWTGYYSAAEGYMVKPDVMCLGKRIAMGFPMSATLMTEDVGAAIHLGEHFNTFAGSPFVCFMAVRWLDYLKEGGLKDIRFKGGYIANALRKFSWIKRVNQYGMMISFLPDYDGYDGPALCKAARERGLLIITHRPLGEIRFTPAVTTHKNLINMALEALEAAHADLL